MAAEPAHRRAARYAWALLEWTTDVSEVAARLLLKLMRDPATAARGDALRAHVLRHYSWHENLARVEPILEGEALARG